jgi:hypothetical protein
MSTEGSSRTELLQRQGLTESAFAVLTAVLLFGSSATPGAVLAVGTLAIWMAWRARRRVELAAPLGDAERRELQQLAGGSRHVRELLDLLARAGQQPVRFDLARCRRLAQLESMLDGRG